MDWTYWFLPMQARQEAVEWEDLRRALGLPVDCWEDLGGQVALGAMWVCHKPAAKYCTPAWNLIFSFLSYFFIFSISQHFSIWSHTKNQHIDLVIQCYSSFHRVNPMGEIPLLIISLVKSAADADRRRERQHLEDVARIAEVKQLLERLAVWRRLGAGVLFGKSVYCLSLSIYIY